MEENQTQVEILSENTVSHTQNFIMKNTIALAVILGSLIVAGSVIAGAYILRGPSPEGDKNVAVKVTDRNDEPSIGRPNAPLTVYEFGDFQCPFCKQFFTQSFADIKTKYIDTGKIRLVFRHFPLNQIHVNAEISSEAAECANRQGQFEAYYTTLYTKGQGDGTGLDSVSLKKYANDLGLNMSSFNSCLDNHETKDVVAKDLALGTSLGVNGTPTFFINNGLLLGAQPTSVIEQAFDDALKNK